MREILFRAKSVTTGNWVYGDLYTHGVHTIWCNGQKIAVEEDTVGEYTGVVSADGVRIFEGDIVRMGDNGYRYTVVWDDSAFKGKQESSSSYIGLNFHRQWLHIVGNIHTGEGGAE